MKEHPRREAVVKLSVGGGGEAVKTVFQVVAAYDDAPARDRALNLFHRIEQQLGGDYEFESSWWRLDHLRETPLLEQAADDAIRANMIILSLRETPELPPTSKAWIRSWLSRRGSQKAALVALVAGEHREKRDEAPLLPSLESVAREAQMDFFLQWFDPASPQSLPQNTAGADPVPAGSPDSSPLLSTRQPMPRWGINE
jgi:hypothetical protein